jgi:hypothetical protein
MSLPSPFPAFEVWGSEGRIRSPSRETFVLVPRNNFTPGPHLLSLPDGGGKVGMPDHHDTDNRSDQRDPNHNAHWESRGEDERPEDREERVAEEDEED